MLLPRPAGYSILEQMPQTPIISLKNVEKFYQHGLQRTYVLRRVSLDFKPGEFVSIMGPSGAGKSTLLHILGMHDASWTGEYFLHGEPIHALGKRERAELQKKHIGFVFQSYHLLDHLTVYENLDMPLSYRDVKKKERDSMVCDMLDRFQIVGKKDLYPSQLSGGQQQLVAVARALISKPTIILADEPTGNLHSEQGREIMELFQRLNAEGTTILQVTHSETNAAFGIADRAPAGRLARERLMPDFPAAPPRPASASPDVLVKARILLADDQADVLQALRLLLKAEGCEIETATSPAGVLAAVDAREFDVALIDLNYTRDTTSGEEGLSLLSRLQQLDTPMPVVVMTAWGTVDLAVEAMRRGARDFIQKPWDNERVLAVVRTQVELGRALRRSQRLEAENRLLRDQGTREAVAHRRVGGDAAGAGARSPASARRTRTC